MKIIIRDNADKVAVDQSVSIFPIVIGRGRKSSLQLTFPSISLSHAKLSYENNELVLEDLESSNGTFFDGRAIKRKVLSLPATFHLGKDIRVELVDDGAIPRTVPEQEVPELVGAVEEFSHTIYQGVQKPSLLVRLQLRLESLHERLAKSEGTDLVLFATMAVLFFSALNLLLFGRNPPARYNFFQGTICVMPVATALLAAVLAGPSMLVSRLFPFKALYPPALLMGYLTFFTYQMAFPFFYYQVHQGLAYAIFALLIFIARFSLLYVFSASIVPRAYSRAAAPLAASVSVLTIFVELR